MLLLEEIPFFQVLPWYLNFIVNPSYLYQNDYPYESSLTKAGQAHYNKFAENVISKFTFEITSDECAYRFLETRVNQANPTNKADFNFLNKEVDLFFNREEYKPALNFLNLIDQVGTMAKFSIKWFL